AISARDSQLGLINRLITRSAPNDPFASELGFGIQVIDVDNNPSTLADDVFQSVSVSQVKGLFLDNATLAASLDIHPDLAYNPNGISGSVKFGFVSINAGTGTFGTLNYDGSSNPMQVSVKLKDQTTGATRLYISDLMNGTSSANILNMIQGPTF